MCGDHVAAPIHLSWARGRRGVGYGGVPPEAHGRILCGSVCGGWVKIGGRWGLWVWWIGSATVFPPRMR